MAKKRSSKKAIIAAIIGVVALGVIIAAFVFKGGATDISVTTAKVERRTITQTVSAIGKIQPETEVKISSQTSGEVMFLGVKEGDTVKGKSLLVRINPDIVETQLEQFKASAEATKIDIDATKANKDRAESEFKRAKELFGKEYLSKQEFESARATYESAVANYKSSMSRYEQSKASLRQMERSIARTTIYSPITGVVTALNVEKGEKVVGTEMMQGTEMMRISDLTVMNAEVDVDENDIVLVKTGDTANVEVDAVPGKILKGVVIEIGHSAKLNSVGTQDQVTNFSVKIRIVDPEARLRPGMSCNVEIQTETRENVLSVPLQSVTIRDDKPAEAAKDEVKGSDMKVEKEKKEIGVKKAQSVVFIKNGNLAKMVKVESGVSDKGFIEIKSGLKEGDEVISGSFQAVSKLLSDGAKIKIDVVDKNKKKDEKKQ